MGLFQNDKTATNYYEYQNSRAEFTKENSKMKLALEEKTLDPQNIEYDKVHVTIYEGVGLGENWRVESSLDSQEIDSATEGFVKVRKKFQSIPQKQKSNILISIIRRVFGKK